MSEKSKKKKDSIIPRTPAGMIVFVMCLLLIFLIIYPLFWIIMSSFKDYAGIYQDVWGLPQEWHFENYLRAWDRGISQYFFNSVIVTIVTLAGVVFVASCMSFGIVQLKGKLSNLMFLLTMGCMLLSPQVCVLPLFVLLRSFGLNDTYFSMIFPYIAFRLPISVMLIRSFFVSISKELEEAAIIDGASMWQIFTKIYVPLSKPILSTVIIMTTYYAWNEFMFATILVDSSELRTIPVGLMVFRDGLMTEWGVVMAGMVISCIPLITIYLFMSKSFVRGLTAGSVKG